MRYKAIFIDIDDTILDYIPCCREAFNCALKALNDEMSAQNTEQDTDRITQDQLFELFFSISGRLFAEAKHGLHTIAEVMELYPREFVREYRARTAFADRVQTEEQMTDTFKHAFRAGWGKTHTLVPDARETLEALHQKGYRLFAASNSFGHLQRSRLKYAGVLHLFEDTYISMDIGYDKPDIRFYEEALRRCGLDAHDVLMVGDSMTTDIHGARMAGLDTCFFDRRNELTRERVNELTHEGLVVIHALPELLSFL